MRKNRLSYLFSLLLVIAMLLGMLTSCGSSRKVVDLGPYVIIHSEYDRWGPAEGYPVEGYAEEYPGIMIADLQKSLGGEEWIKKIIKKAEKKTGYKYDIEYPSLGNFYDVIIEIEGRGSVVSIENFHEIEGKRAETDGVNVFTRAYNGDVITVKLTEDNDFEAYETDKQVKAFYDEVWDLIGVEFIPYSYTVNNYYSPVNSVDVLPNNIAEYAKEYIEKETECSRFDVSGIYAPKYGEELRSMCVLGTYINSSGEEINKSFILYEIFCTEGVGLCADEIKEDYLSYDARLYNVKEYAPEGYWVIYEK